MRAKLLSCDCCKENLPSAAFSGNHRHGDYSYFCKSCQVWLRLFREVCSADEKKACNLHMARYTRTQGAMEDKVLRAIEVLETVAIPSPHVANGRAEFHAILRELKQ